MFDFERYYTELEEKRRVEVFEIAERRLEFEKTIVRDQVKTIFERIQQTPPLNWCTWINIDGMRRVSWSILSSSEDCSAFITILPDGKIVWDEHYYQGHDEYLKLLDLDSFIGFDENNLQKLREYIIEYGEAKFDIPKEKISEWQEMSKKLRDLR